jgi:hypothetical protein
MNYLQPLAETIGIEEIGNGFSFVDALKMTPLALDSS